MRALQLAYEFGVRKSGLFWTCLWTWVFLIRDLLVENETTAFTGCYNFAHVSAASAQLHRPNYSWPHFSHYHLVMGAMPYGRMEAAHPKGAGSWGLLLVLWAVWVTGSQLGGHWRPLAGPLAGPSAGPVGGGFGSVRTEEEPGVGEWANLDGVRGLQV